MASVRTTLHLRLNGLSAPLILAVVLVLPASLRAQATIGGTVTDTAGVPIVGAEIAVESTAVRVRSDDRGAFHLTSVPFGTREITARRLGFAPFQIALQVSQENSADVSIRMIPVAAMLPPVLVHATQMRYSGRLAGYYKRLERKSSGYFITREQIDRENPSSMGQLLQHAPGVRSMSGRRGTAVRLRGRTCWPLVWIDGTPMPAGDVDMDAFVPSSIQGIELYLGSTTAPIGYIYDGDRSSCGTILIWSRGPDTDPTHSPPAQSVDLEDLVNRGQVYTAHEVDQPARLENPEQVKPAFPPSLFASRTSGLVVVEFVVDTVGRIEEGTVGVVSSTAPPFALSVRNALANATFAPASKGGHHVRQLVQQPFRFNVEQETAEDR